MGIINFLDAVTSIINGMAASANNRAREYGVPASKLSSFNGVSGFTRQRGSKDTYEDRQSKADMLSCEDEYYKEQD